jgi:UDP-N-acetyl-D-mannosaminuronate dehydrogenase
MESKALGIAKVKIEIEMDISNDHLTRRSPLMRLLRILGKEQDSQVKWYDENRERILAKETEKRQLYAKKHTKVAETNQVVMPTPPADNILKFP